MNWKTILENMSVASGQKFDDATVVFAMQMDIYKTTGNKNLKAIIEDHWIEQFKSIQMATMMRNELNASQVESMGIVIDEVVTWVVKHVGGTVLPEPIQKLSKFANIKV